MKTIDVDRLTRAAISVGDTMDSMNSHLKQFVEALATRAYYDGLLGVDLPRGWMVSTDRDDWHLTLNGLHICAGTWCDDDEGNTVGDCYDSVLDLWMDDGTITAVAQLARDAADDDWLQALEAVRSPNTGR